MKKITIKQKEFKELKKNLKKLLFNYMKCLLGLTIFECACAYLFYYVEHCSHVTPRGYTGSEGVVLRACAMTNHPKYNRTESNMLRNDLMTFCEEELGKIEAKRTRKCNLTASAFSEWFDFVYITALTIGYGNTVPYSAVGKILTIVLSIPLIGMTGINLTYAGDLIVTLTKVVMVKFERSFYHRKSVKICAKKVCVVQFMLLLLVWILFAWCAYYVQRPRLAPIDAIYFVYVTLTTIGYGDYYFPVDMRVKHVALSIIVTLLLTVAMATLASVITSIAEIVRSMKIGEELRASLRRSIKSGRKVAGETFSMNQPE
ncbi:potassium channel subfamily K member 2-like [Clytia hemisphaerica]|uniref:potassium channel subfamily K member 2-like n=1 Tax=Clytia hemisphaerica TaxID=252671 RepID=UPI0034D71BCA